MSIYPGKMIVNEDADVQNRWPTEKEVQALQSPRGTQFQSMLNISSLVAFPIHCSFRCPNPGCESSFHHLHSGRRWKMILSYVSLNGEAAPFSSCFRGFRSDVGHALAKVGMSSGKADPTPFLQVVE